MIDYSCNYTSWESNGPMSRVKIQTFRPNPGPSSVNYDLDRVQGRVTLYMQKVGIKNYCWE